MKHFRLFLIVVIALSLVFAVGCAARKTVKPDTSASDSDSTGMVDEPVDEPVMTSSGKKYIVKRGDTLWGISSKGNIYSDSFQWPLLYKANRDEIQDPDLIEVDQELDVREDWSRSEVRDAVQKAKDTPPYVPHTAPRKSLPLRY